MPYYTILDWTIFQTQYAPKNYTCGHCGREVSSEKCLEADVIFDGNFEKMGLVYICPGCKKPTFFDEKNTQYPGYKYGSNVKGVPPDVESIYNESRLAFSVGAYTCATLASRKLLMNIAVANGAEENKKFAEYVDYLENNRYTPPNSKIWIDHIRKKGNEATHEIPSISEQDTKDLIDFTEMLLKFIYEYPSKLSPNASP
jgi:DNA-directed RNA polymerase subunit RPC12/RpoP